MSRWHKWVRPRSAAPTRRAFLGGAAATVALPFLPSLRGAQAGQEPVRLVWFYVPNGFHMPAWTPATEGADFELPPILEPLAPVRDSVLVLSGLDNAPAFQAGVAGDHGRGTGAFLTCVNVRKTEGADIAAGISADQVAAQALGDQTLFPSLQLGIAGGAPVGNCDSGYSCAYTRNISWAGEATPLPKMTDPQQVFDRLFAGFSLGLSEAEAERRKARRASVLDHVAQDARTLQGRLGATDRSKLDEYLTGVRELEVRIATGAELLCDPGVRPEADPIFIDHVDLMGDLLVRALQCDATRIVSFMLGNGAWNRSYSFLGTTGGHHELSHHQGNPAHFDALTTIGRWEVQQLATLLGRLRAVQAGSGTLLDSTLLCFSSEIADGNAHGHFDLPVLLCGGAGVQSGRHLRYGGEPIADLYIAMLQRAGVNVERFGEDGTRALPGL